MRLMRCLMRKMPYGFTIWPMRRLPCGELDPLVRSRTIVHLHTQCGNGVYMPVWTDLFDPELPEEHGPVWTSPDVWVFTADLPIEWPGEMLTNRLLAEGCTRFENHIVEAPEN